MYMYVHVCTDDIHSLQFTMQIFIGKVYMGKYVDKQGKARTPSSSLIIAYNIECIGEGQWNYYKGLIWTSGHHLSSTGPDSRL